MKTIVRNINVKDLAPKVDEALDAIATMRRLPKYRIVREALEEYVAKHTERVA